MRDENEDLLALIDGDGAAWGRFVKRYAPVIFAAVQRKLLPAGRIEDAEDVAQDVFLRLCRNDFRLLRTYDRKRAKLTTWLTVVAMSASIDHLRRQRARHTDIEKLPESLLAVEDRHIEKIKLPEGLLSERQALIIKLLYDREMEAGEVAKLLGIDPQTVRSTHHKALTKLRAHFAEDEEQ